MQKNVNIQERKRQIQKRSKEIEMKQLYTKYIQKRNIHRDRYRKKEGTDEESKKDSYRKQMKQNKAIRQK